MEEEWMAEPPVLGKQGVNIPEFTQEEPEDGPPAAPMTSDGDSAAIPLDDDDALSQDGFAALQDLGAADDDLTTIDGPVSDEDWLARNPTLADALSETSAPVKAIPNDTTRTLEVDLGPVADADLDGADALPPVLPVSLPPTPARAQASTPRPPSPAKGKEGLPSWAMGVGGGLAVAVLVFFVLTSQEDNSPPTSATFSDPVAQVAPSTAQGMLPRHRPMLTKKAKSPANPLRNHRPPQFQRSHKKSPQPNNPRTHPVRFPATKKRQRNR